MAVMLLTGRRKINKEKLTDTEGAIAIKIRETAQKKEREKWMDSKNNKRKE